VRPFLRDAGLADSPLVADGASCHRLLELLRPRAKRLTDFAEQARPLVSDTVEFDPEAVEKNLSIPELGAHVEALANSLRTTSPFDETSVEAAVRGTAAGRGLKAGPIIHLTRLAVTGRANSPGLFEVLAWLGRDRVLNRITQLQALIERRASSAGP
jgi:glutamyl/glutaminyl-tRNA synthetase